MNDINFIYNKETNEISYSIISDNNKSYILKPDISDLLKERYIYRSLYKAIYFNNCKYSINMYLHGSKLLNDLYKIKIRIDNKNKKISVSLITETFNTIKKKIIRDTIIEFDEDTSNKFINNILLFEKIYDRNFVINTINKREDI